MDEATSGPPGRWQVEPETKALRVLQTAMTDAETAMARRMRLGQTDMAAMTHLASARHSVGPGWLSARLGLTPAAATELVDRLEKAGLVRRERDPDYRRKVFIATVPENIAKVGRFYEHMQRGMVKLRESYSDAELRLLLEFASKGYETMLAATEELKSMVDAPKERPAKKGKASGPNKRA